MSGLISRLQGGLALVLAVGAHGAILTLRPSEGAATAAGDYGDALVSVQEQAASVRVAPVSKALADLVAEWEAPPKAELAPEAPVAPPPEMDRPVLPTLAEPTMPTPIAVQLPVMDAVPVVDELPKPEPVPEPKPEPKPEKKPEPKAEPKKEKPQKAKPQQAASKGQKAAGSGGGATAGEGGKATAGTGTKGQDSIKAEWGATLRARIERRKSYPRGADGAEGRVKLRLTVDTGGNLVGVSISQSSGNAALDQAAVKAVQSARFPSAPKGLEAGQHSFNLPLDFTR